jgi:hypothetical protein
MWARLTTIAFVFFVGTLPAIPGQAKKNPPPLTDADLQKMPAAEVKELFKHVKLPEDDPDPDPQNKGKSGAPSTGEIKHSGMDYGPCLACTVDLPDPAKKKGDEAGKNVVLRGLVVKLPHDMTVCYDLDTLAVAAAWQGGFLDLSKTNHENSKGAMAPQVPWPVWFTNINTPGWADKEGKFNDSREGKLGPLPADWLKYHGHYLSGDRVVLKYSVQGREVLEMPGAEKHGDQLLLTRTFRVAPSDKRIEVQVAHDGGEVLVVAGIANNKNYHFDAKKITIEPTADAVICKLFIRRGPRGNIIDAMGQSPPAEDLSTLIKGGPKRWGKPLETAGATAKDNPTYPYVVDTLAIPFNNPHKSWMRTAAHDFFSDGRLAVSTLNGDVWIVDGIDNDLKSLKWTRFATGLYEPLGLKIVKDQVYVLGRDRITRLHDLNGDGEADFYESFWADGNVAPSFHAFSFDLQTDKAGNFYFLKSGRRVEKERPGHGALIKVSPDGKKSEIVATGFRHPNGMGIGPQDQIVVSDNQGEWVPSSKVSLIKPGGFYGYPRIGEPTPTKYEPPLFWLPMNLDNSSGGQCWAGDKWGPLSRKLLHTSYGSCSLFYVIPEMVNGGWNAAVVQMPLKFRSGIMRARVNPKDGQVYVVGLRGWQTQAEDIGCVQRVRYTGGKGVVVTGVATSKNYIEISFSEPTLLPMDGPPARLEQWNYIWSHYYGSPQMSPSEPAKVGHDTIEVAGLGVPMTGKWLGLETKQPLQPVHQLRIRLNLHDGDGNRVQPTIYLTINAIE